jgi:putative ABC transport system substrate-binding protein
VDVIVAPGPVAVAAARAATSTIPVIMIAGVDPVAAGWVTSLPRPGGNVTGFTVGASPELGAKWVELLKEAAPRLTRIAVFQDARVDAAERAISLQPMQSAARALRLQIHPLAVAGPDEFAAATSEAAKGRADALATYTTPMLDLNQEQIIALTVRYRWPSIALFGHYAIAGGLLSYGPDLSAIFRSVAYVDRILNGAKAAELPVQQPSQVKLVLNSRTAKILKLQIPRSLLARADQVIE